jgi:hypothetical protein
MYAGRQRRLFTKVPRIGRVLYGNEGFHGFLERLGTTTQELLQIAPGDPSELTMISAAQELLVFVLLHESACTLGSEIDLSTFLDSISRRYITFGPLPTFTRNLIMNRVVRPLDADLADWNSMLASNSLDSIALLAAASRPEVELESRRERVSSCLSTASKFLVGLLEAIHQLRQGALASRLPCA